MESEGGRGCFSCFRLVVFIVTIWAGTSISRSATRTKKILQDLSCKKGRGADLFIRYWRRCDFSLYGTFTAEIVPLRGGLCRWNNFSVAAKNTLGGFLCLILVPGEFLYNSYVCTNDRGCQVAPGYREKK